MHPSDRMIGDAFEGGPGMSGIHPKATPAQVSRIRFYPPALLFRLLPFDQAGVAIRKEAVARRDGMRIG
jgi:hypothetical protein